MSISKIKSEFDNHYYRNGTFCKITMVYFHGTKMYNFFSVFD